MNLESKDIFSKEMLMINLYFTILLVQLKFYIRDCHTNNNLFNPLFPTETFLLTPLPLYHPIYLHSNIFRKVKME